jgi:hypothetical protein
LRGIKLSVKPKGTVDMEDLLATDSDENIKQNLLHFVVEDNERYDSFIKNGGKVGRKNGFTKDKETLLNQHKDIVKDNLLEIQ